MIVALGRDVLIGRQRHAGGVLARHAGVVAERREGRGDDLLRRVLVGDRRDVERLEAALRAGIRKIDRWTAEHGIAHAQFDGDPDPFFNANTPADLAEAEQHLQTLPPND